MEKRIKCAQNWFLPTGSHFLPILQLSTWCKWAQFRGFSFYSPSSVSAFYSACCCCPSLSDMFNIEHGLNSELSDFESGRMELLWKKSSYLWHTNTDCVDNVLSEFAIHGPWTLQIFFFICYLLEHTTVSSKLKLIIDLFNK